MYSKIFSSFMIIVCIFCSPAVKSLEDVSDTYMPKVDIQRETPLVLSRTLWITAYTASVFVLSQLDLSNYVLGVFYFIPSMSPFYKWDPNNTETNDFVVTGENIGLGVLSAYSFFAVNPETQTTNEVFRDQVYANLIVWGSLWASRKAFGNQSYFLLPVNGLSGLSLNYRHSFLGPLRSLSFG